MHTKQKIEQLLASAGTSPNKRRGQNFLIDLNLMGMLIHTSGINETDLVLEVGSGTGSMTEELAASSGRVITVEIDTTLAGIVQSQTSSFENLTVINDDILENKNTISSRVTGLIKSEREKFSRFILIANLPYSVACPVMINLINGAVPADEMYVTVQKEVAERMTAAAGSGHYGTLSILTAACGKAKILKTLKASVFWPRPQVDSAMVSFIRDEEAVKRIHSMDIFSETVSLFMQHRRKMIKACTRFAQGKLEKIKNWNCIFEESFIDSHKRPEELSPQEYISIANSCSEMI